MLPVLAVRFIGLAGAHSFDAFFGNAAVMIPMAALSIPLYDTNRVFGSRILRGQSPFTADADHVHHTLLSMGWGQKRIVLYLYAVTLLMVTIAYLCSGLNVNLSLAIVLLSSVLLLPTSGLKRKNGRLFGLDITAILRPSHR